MGGGRFENRGVGAQDYLLDSSRIDRLPQILAELLIFLQRGELPFGQVSAEVGPEMGNSRPVSPPTVSHMGSDNFQGREIHPQVV